MENEPLPGEIEPQKKEYTEGAREEYEENIPGPSEPDDEIYSQVEMLLGS